MEQQDKFTFTNEGINQAIAYLKEIGIGLEYTDTDAVHFANYQYNRLNKSNMTMTFDEMHGIKPKEK